MTLLDGLGRGIDRLIEVVAPRAQETRQLARLRLARHRLHTRYAAAKTSRLTGEWRPVEDDVNTLIGSASATVRSRVRQLVRDFPYFSNAVDTLTTLTIGPGISFQSAAPEPYRERIEEAWAEWSDSDIGLGVDSTGRLSFNDLSELAYRQELECGELLIVKRIDRARRIPITFSPIEPDRLSGFGGKPRGTNLLEQGIETDKISGAPKAYHFSDDDRVGRTLRVDTADVIHHFKTLRPGQIRGISKFAPAVLLAHDLSDYMEAEVDGAKLASKWLAFIKQGMGGYRPPGAQDPDTGHLIDELENGIIEYLDPGQDVELASHNRPGTNFGPFVKLLLQMLAVTTGCSYERLSGDYSGVSFSALRALKNGDVERARPWQKTHIKRVCNPVYVSWLDVAVLVGAVDLPGYWANPGPYRKAKWYPPGLESTDQLRDSKSSTHLIGSGLMSPQEVISQRGRDPEEVLEEIAKFNELAKKRGVSISFGSTANANNPAALGASES